MGQQFNLNSKVRFLFTNINNIHYFIDSKFNDILKLLYNNFLLNEATENGAALYISKKNCSSSITVTGNLFFKNYFVDSNKNEIGSVIYLEDPGNISIENSNFTNNIAIMGTCIYYSESFDNVFLTLNGNLFMKNKAKFGGAGIFLKNNYQNVYLLENNIFLENSAQYGKNLTTSPFRIVLQKDINKTELKKLKLRVVPGMTIISLYFQILDYFEGVITALSQGNSILSIYTQKNTFLKIAGANTAAIVNG